MKGINPAISIITLNVTGLNSQKAEILKLGYQKKMI